MSCGALSLVAVLCLVLVASSPVVLARQLSPCSSASLADPNPTKAFPAPYIGPPHVHFVDKALTAKGMTKYPPLANLASCSLVLSFILRLLPPCAVRSRRSDPSTRIFGTRLLLCVLTLSLAVSSSVVAIPTSPQINQ